MKKNTGLYASLLLAVSLQFCIVSISAQNAFPSKEMPLKAIDAPEWDDIFKRTSGSGWYSGDGIFMVPFSGDDRQGQKQSTKTLILFSDSHTCENMDANTYVVSGDKMMNHAIGVLSPLQDLDQQQFTDVEYHWGEDDGKRITGDRNIFIEHAWAMDGLYQDGKIHMFMTVEVNKAGVSGVNMVHIPIVDNDIDLTNSANMMETTPFFCADGDNNTRLGSALMDNSIAGGAHTPDGYIYVYGARKVKTKRGAVVSRVAKADFTDFSKYEFWNGSQWTTDFMDLDSDDAEIFPIVSSDRYSVTPIRTGPFSGKYMAIYSRKLSQPVVEYKIADSPVGPWSDGVPVWGIVDEMDELGPNIPNFYGAKAHQHLSDPGELLISYCVNCYQPNVKDHNKNRGRFFRIDLNELATSAPQFIVSHTYEKTNASGFNGSTYKHTKAFNVNARDESKWQDVTSGDKWISIDLGQEYYIDRWQMLNEGQLSGNSHLNTRDFKLQVNDSDNDDNGWKDVDIVFDNTADIYDAPVKETKGRYWRVYITTPSQDGSDVANVLNINLFGRTNAKPVDATITDKPINEDSAIVYPTLVKDVIHIVDPKTENNIKVYSVSGGLCVSEITSASSINLSTLPPGSYILCVNNVSTRIVKE
ncbi:DUF4185 domain-containing protein [Carboxylicivirga sp. RSCT41]|uniref:DUF4185 domain-containing protein n=1 Tax=Carboxylicivirga agarovorans TaxID=3417570 RepID=UPI003D342ABA